MGRIIQIPNQGIILPDYRRRFVEPAGGGGTLDDTALQVRYYFDEVTSGLPGDLTVVDHGPATAMDLTLTDNVPSRLRYAGSAPQLALESHSSTTHDGRAQADIAAGDKIDSNLIGSKVATLEIVFSLSAGTTNVGRLFVINGSGGENARFGIVCDNAAAADWQFFLNGSKMRDVAQSAGTRYVVHIVLDTNLATADDRIKIYVNGSLASPTVVSNPSQNSTLTDAGQDIFLNAFNRESSGSWARAVEGFLYYAALYSAAFSASRVSDHYDILTTDDDTP